MTAGDGPADASPAPDSKTAALAGKTALVTGSVQGLGLATAECLAEAGCDVVLNGFAEAASVAAIRARLEGRYRVRTVYSGADLRRPDEIEQMMATAVETFGSIDVLVNNAVVRHAAPVEAFPTEHWDEALAVNLSAAFHLIRLAIPHMRRKNWGRIINVSSIYGLRAAADRIAYVTTKTALLGMTRAVALETLGHNITCNAVCPGTTETPVHEAKVREVMETEGLSRSGAEQRVLSGKQPSGRFIPPANVAALIVFLCGPESADITGAALPIDGAWSAH